MYNTLAGVTFYACVKHSQIETNLSNAFYVANYAGLNKASDCSEKLSENNINIFSIDIETCFVLNDAKIDDLMKAV